MIDDGNSEKMPPRRARRTHRNNGSDVTDNVARKKSIPKSISDHPQREVGQTPKLSLGKNKDDKTVKINAAKKIQTIKTDGGAVATKKSSTVKSKVSGASKTSSVAVRKTVGSVQRSTIGRKAVAKSKHSVAWKWARRIIISSFTIGLLGIIALCALFVFSYWTIKIPNPERAAQGQISTVYFADGKTKIGTFGEQNRQIIDTRTLPEYIGKAVVASEDRTFFQNNGVDIKGITRALWNNVRGLPRQGGSTLSQQYVERYYTGSNETYVSKFKETILALKINRQQSKQEILNNYLNTIYFGRGTYGIQAASLVYFGKPATEMTLSEAALLAGIIPSPARWDPAVNNAMAQQRWKRVITLMKEDGWITAEQANTAKFPDVRERSKKEAANKGPNGYLLAQVRDELETKVGFSQGQIDSLGARIVTTIDPKLQEIIQKAGVDLPNDAPPGLRVAITAIDPKTGSIVAEFGGSDYQKIQRNAASQDRALGGSTFKTFTLVAALEKGATLNDIYDGNAVKVGDKLINNYGNVQWGSVSLAKATRFSINGAFIRLNQKIGPEATVNAAIRAGIPKNTPGLEANISNALGTASPHNLDLAAAYATFANGGVYNAPHIIAEVKDLQGDVVYHASKIGRRVFQKDIVQQLTRALAGVADEDRRFTSFKRPYAAKTGSAQDNRAAQFVGFTPQLVTAVSLYQVGPKGEEQSITPFGGVREVVGVTHPARIWGHFMNEALKDKPIEQLDTGLPSRNYHNQMGLNTNAPNSGNINRVDNTDGINGNSGNRGNSPNNQ